MITKTYYYEWIKRKSYTDVNVCTVYCLDFIWGDFLSNYNWHTFNNFKIFILPTFVCMHYKYTV